MTIRKKINGITYQFVEDDIIEDGYYILDESKRTYSFLDSVPNDVKLDFDKILAIRKSNLYKDLRKKEYDKLNQFELFYNDQSNGTTSWIDSINEIKKKYPKPKK